MCLLSLRPVLLPYRGLAVPKIKAKLQEEGIIALTALEKSADTSLESKTMRQFWKRNMLNLALHQDAIDDPDCIYFKQHCRSGKVFVCIGVQK